MAFWGVEVKPGKPYTHVYDEARGRLRITMATLGNGKATSKSVVQCNVGKKSPILLCSLVPDKAETCHLELEFEEDNEVVFSVLGQRSVYLCGFYLGPCRGHGDGGDETDSYGEDIGEEDSESYGSFDSEEDEYESDFIDDGDIEMFSSSPQRKSSVIIEEIVDDDKPAHGNGIRRRLKKKSQLVESDSGDDDSKLQLVVKSNNNIEVFESEDDDGFPISLSVKKKDAANNFEVNKKSGSTVNDDKKLKIDAISQRDESTRDATQPRDSSVASVVVPETDGISKKKKRTREDVAEAKTETNENNHMIGLRMDVTESDGKKKKKKEKTKKDKKSDVGDDYAMERTEEGFKGDGNEVFNANSLEQNHPLEAEKLHYDHVPDDNGLAQDAKKKKKKKKKKTKKDKSHDKDSTSKEESLNPLEAEHKAEPQKTRTFSNGLRIEELSMGKPDGKKASPGSRVSVNYIGKLNNGKIFDSNVGKRPFKFRLGVGHVIKGWDVGIAGMRIGDKRRLIIPPSMGYGASPAGKIPGNSWLVFDVELLKY
ncbi:hypothetical protein C4D60_Mb03t07730 [Musa balbisiana]|uniref:peptidylprolyl isomerase n=1 Tax=Musa balbisiana TaxID=52838 RepID=A0A4S8J891_MUSBA|nr:hypothetical protein C4D60_Mb03t07730 [Musa balbisiana]